MKLVLSIVIPVYNSENYIVATLYSVIETIVDGVEVIIVNDGSTDKSVDVINKHFAAELVSGQFSLIAQKNAGVSVARNTGISQSKGEYLAFVDADDLLLSNYCSEIMDVINTSNPDIIEFGYKNFVSPTDLSTASERFIHKIFGLSKTLVLQDEIFLKSTWYPWARVFKASYFDRHEFPIGVRFCEDMMCIYKIYNESDTIYLINKALYGYRINPEGATLNMKVDYLEQMILFYNSIIMEKSKHMIYLKINALYVIYRSSLELNKSIKLPFNILIDSKLVFFATLLDSSLPSRKKQILAFPNIHAKLARFKRALRNKK